MIDEAKKFVEALRAKCSEQGDCNSCAKSDYCYYGGDYAMRNEAADLIESLAAELEQVKQERDGLSIMLTQAQTMLETRTRERDAAVEGLRGICYACKNDTPGKLYRESPVCLACMHNMDDEDLDDNWQWRGVKEET